MNNMYNTLSVEEVRELTDKPIYDISPLMQIGDKNYRALVRRSNDLQEIRNYLASEEVIAIYKIEQQVFPEKLNYYLVRVFLKEDAKMLKLTNEQISEFTDKPIRDDSPIQTFDGFSIHASTALSKTFDDLKLFLSSDKVLAIYSIELTPSGYMSRTFIRGDYIRAEAATPSKHE